MTYRRIKIPPDLKIEGLLGGSMYPRFENFEKKLLDAGFYDWSKGGFRRVYRRGSIVIKVPINGDGVVDNIVEALSWKKYGNKPTNRYIYLTPCRLLPNLCLMMKKIDYLNSEPAWRKNLTDPQVGSYRGRDVVYDYAFEVTERNDIEDELGVESEFWNSDFNSHRRAMLKEPPLVTF